METHLITAGEVARQAGVVVSTVSKKLKSGKLSYVERTPDGGYLIDPAEAARVFPRIVSGNSPDGDSRTPPQEVVNTLRQQVAMLTDQLGKANDRETFLQGQLERMTLLLAAPKPEAEPSKALVPVPAPAAEVSITGAGKPADALGPISRLLHRVGL